MCPTFDPFRLLLISVAGWWGQQQRDAIDYLREENRVLREQLGDRRLRLNDDQRRRRPRRRDLAGEFFGRSPPSCRQKRFYNGIGSSLLKNTMEARNGVLVAPELSVRSRSWLY